MKNQRNTSIELLRIIAMLMVISLHYLGKGGVTAVEAKNAVIPFNYYFGNLIDYAALAAVNLFFLISGYCLYDAPFKMQRLIALWLQVMFYTIAIAVLFMLLGIYPAEFKTTVYYTMIFAPFFSEHYWFANCYGMLFILTPFINAALKNLGLKTHLFFAIALFLIFSNVNPLVLYTNALYNDNGYGVRWALCVYVAGAFIKRLTLQYGHKFISKKISAYALTVYLASVVFQFILYGVCAAFGDRSELLARIFAYRIHYNSFILYVEAIALFICFVAYPKKEKNTDSISNRFILGVSPLLLGVYLLHEHFLLRPLWTKLWKVDAAFEKPYFALHFVAVVLIVFIIGCVIEYVRQKIYAPIYRSAWYNRLYRATFKKLDTIINENR